MKHGANLVESLAHSGLEIRWMKAVQQKHVRYEFILSKAVDDLPTSVAGCLRDFHHSVDAGGMNLHPRLDEFERGVAQSWIGGVADLRDQRIDLLNAFFQLIVHGLLSKAKHRRMVRLEDFAASDVHMHAA